MEMMLLEQFKKIISDKTGLHVPDQDSKKLSDLIALRRKSHNLSGVEEYYHLLAGSGGQSRDEWREIMLYLTTGESYFFRDKGHFFLLRNIVLPDLIKSREKEHALRIWSAGCSTGEEPYSVAILLDMLLPDLKAWDISIIGTDINEDALKKAERGIYTQWSFRTVDKEIQRKYFSRHHKDEWEIDGRIKKMVKFRQGNLMEDDFPSQASGISTMDSIVCRNVFIYFKSESVSAVLAKFTRTLNPGGYLITGHGELFGQDHFNLNQIMLPEAVIYKKVAGSGKTVHEFRKEIKDARTKETKPIHTLSPISGLNTKNFISKTPSPLPSPSRGEGYNTTPLLRGGDEGEGDVCGFTNDRISKSTKENPKKQMEGLIESGRHSAAHKKAGKVLNVCSEDYEMHFMTAQSCANFGDYEKAENSCRKAIQIHPTSAGPYFLLAQIVEAKGCDEAAKDFLKNALYLDPAFIAAYIELGGLYEKGNDLRRANKSRSTAIELLRSLPSQEHIKPYNMTAGELLGYVENLTIDQRPKTIDHRLNTRDHRTKTIDNRPKTIDQRQET